MKDHPSQNYRICRGAFRCVAVVLLTLSTVGSSYGMDYEDPYESRFKIRLEGVFWRLDSTDSTGNSVSIATSWAARIGLLYSIPLASGFGLRPEVGGIVGKFSPPSSYSVSNSNAQYNFLGGSIYAEGEKLSAEFRYLREQFQLSKISGAQISLHPAQSHRYSLRASFVLIPANLKSSQISVGGEYSKLVTDSSVFSTSDVKGTGWGVFVRSGYLFIQYTRDHYSDSVSSNDSSLLSIGFDGLRLGF